VVILTKPERKLTADSRWRAVGLRDGNRGQIVRRAEGLGESKLAEGTTERSRDGCSRDGEEGRRESREEAQTSEVETVGWQCKPKGGRKPRVDGMVAGTGGCRAFVSSPARSDATTVARPGDRVLRHRLKARAAPIIS